MTTKVRDELYIGWIKTLPCHVCKHIAEGTFKRYNKYKDIYESIEKSNCAHHTGDGIHSVRYSDYWTVPLCDLHCDPASANCHHREVHGKPLEYREKMREAAKGYRERYLKEHANG